MTPARGLVLGVGNLLLGDEGVGIHVVRAIARHADESADALPPHTRVVDGGTLGLDLLPFLDEADAVVIVDAANLGGEPGALAVLRDGELDTALAGHLSAHDVGLGDLLAAARLTGSLPGRVSLMAIQPETIEPSLELSPAVAATLPAAVGMVEREAWALAGAGGAPPSAGTVGLRVPAMPG